MQIRPWLAADQLSPATTPTQVLQIRPVWSNRRAPVLVYRIGLTGNRSKPVEVKFEFKNLCANGSYRYTGRLDRFGRFTVDLMIFSDG